LATLREIAATLAENRTPTQGCRFSSPVSFSDPLTFGDASCLT
jgi:hypothetical protein